MTAAEAAAAHQLSEAHRTVLEEGSAISPKVIDERHYYTIDDVNGLVDLPDFRGTQKWTECLPALVIPQYDVSGAEIHPVIRYDRPRVRKDGTVTRYVQPAGVGLRLDVPPRCLAGLRDPHQELWWTEGTKKADALASAGLVAVSTPGVEGWRGFGAIPDLFGIPFKGRVAANERDVDVRAGGEEFGRLVVCAYDSDALTKAPVRMAVESLARWMGQKGAEVLVLDWGRADLPEGQKTGVDDYLALGHTVEDLRQLRTPVDRWLTDTAKPDRRVESVEILDAAPPKLDRPLALVDGHAYAVTWLETRIQERSETNPLDRHVENKQLLFVMRDDGTSYGRGTGQAPIASLPLRLVLPEAPRKGREWRGPGFLAYEAGNRPDPFSVLHRVASVFDRFIDFGQSLAGQEEMCELSACLSLMTWFAPAFDVLGYPWLWGESGSGKTQWGVCWAYTSYLGEPLTTGSSFAALRDLSDQGATQLFDDAEEIGRKTFDPEKLNLFLTGNGSAGAIVIKDKVKDEVEHWQNKWIRTYAPRGFTATQLPTRGPLASRCLIIPLRRTSDARRGNMSPREIRRWPEVLGFSHEDLLSDLWALAVWLLTEAEGVWAELDAEDLAIGRQFEPWRAPVAVARLLDRHIPGLGLERRIRLVMEASGKESADFYADDYLAILLRALVSVLDKPGEGQIEATPADISEACEAVAKREGVDLPVGKNGKQTWPTPEWVGKKLKSLRTFKQRRSHGATYYRIPREEVVARARVYGIPLELDPSPSHSPGTGTTGTTGTRVPE